MFIIQSQKKNIRAISGTNNDVEFHNKLFDTDDCVITFEADPTPEEIEASKLHAEAEQAEAKAKQVKADEEEALINAKIREMAKAELIKEGKILK